MKYLVIILSLLALSACTTVPVVAQFPAAPTFAAQSCADLVLLKPDALLSDVAATVNTNYTSYHECALKNDNWREWYQLQKIIFEKAGK